MNLKPFKDIVAGAIQWIVSHTNKITDFNVGSVIRSIIEAIAVEIEELYYYMWTNFKESVKTAIFYAFDFHYKEPAPAIVNLLFSRTDETDLNVAIPIPAGATVSTESGIYFYVTQDTAIPIGEQSVVAPAICQVPGTIGNVLENTITVVVSVYLQSKVRVTNPEPATGGTDTETDDEIKIRFQEYIQSLAKGTLKALEYGAKTVQGVVGAKAVDFYLGKVNLYVWDYTGSLPDLLKAAVEQEIENWRAGGIQVYIYPPERITTNIDIKVQVSNLSAIDPTQLTTDIQNAVLSINSSITLGKDINIAEIISLAMNVSPYIVDVAVVSPESDIEISEYQLGIIENVNILEITDQEI